MSTQPQKTKNTSILDLNVGKKNIAKTIKSCMSERPSERLQKYITTQDLLYEFFRQRDYYTLLGSALKARFGGGGGNPVYEYWQAGKLCKFEYELISYRVDFYNMLFGLIQISWHFIKNELDVFEKQVIDEYPQSEAEYFISLLTEQYDNRFISCIEGYEFKLTDFEKRLKTTRSIYWRDIEYFLSLPISEEQKKEKDRHKLFYMNFALDIAVIHSKEDEIIKNALNGIRDNILKSTEIVLKYLRQQRSGNTTKLFESYTWKDGRLYLRNQGGLKKALHPMPGVLEE